MMNDFEKHIRSNKDLFDDKVPDTNRIWASIESELTTQASHKKTSSSSRFMRVAASIAIILGLYGSIHLFTTKEQENSIDNGLQDVDMHYTNIVSKQIELVRNHPSLSMEDKKDFLSFMKDLDEEYELLKIELNKNINNELILEAIVKNYKKQIEIIENLLKQISNSKKTNDDYGYIL